MSKCMFRPSDDAVILPFLIPANAMTVVELRKTADMIDSLVVPSNYDQLSEQMRSLADEIDSAIAQYGTTFN
jgi:meiotically up-regulated gene 157 (Mug157) protein